MRPALYLGLCAPFCIYIGLALSAQATAARPIHFRNYDGVYSVEATTSAGACDKIYQVSVTIANSRITAISQPDANASGGILDDGTVSLTFRDNGQVVHIGGRIRGRRGSGAWSSPTAQCGGRWQAKRQG